MDESEYSLLSGSGIKSRLKQTPVGFYNFFYIWHSLNEIRTAIMYLLNFQAVSSGYIILYVDLFAATEAPNVYHIMSL